MRGCVYVLVYNVTGQREKDYYADAGYNVKKKRES